SAKANAYYTLSYKGKLITAVSGVDSTVSNTGLGFYYSDGTTSGVYIYNQADTWQEKTLASNGKTIVGIFILYNYGSWTYYTDIQVEEGKTATEYEQPVVLDSAYMTSSDVVKVPADHRVFADWSANSYTVTFDANSGTVSETTRTVTYDSTYGTLPTPTRTGYTFNGWIGKNLFNAATTTDGYEFSENEIVQNANWFVSDYIPVGENVTIITVNAGARYHFYDENKDLITHLASTQAVTTPAGTAYIRINGAIANKSIIQVEIGSTATDYAPYVVYDGDFVTSSTIVQTPYDHTLTASWAINTCTVTIKSNNSAYGSVDVTTVSNVPYGTVISTSGNTITVNGTTITATPTTSTAQYTYAFSSWTNGTETVTGNLTVTANFTQTTNTYTVTITPSNSSFGSVNVSSVSNVPYGTVITSSGNTVNINGTTVTATAKTSSYYIYSFSSWTNGTATVTGDLTVTAKFTSRAKTATIKLGTLSNISAVYYGTSSTSQTTELTTSGFTAYAFSTYYFKAVLITETGYTTTFGSWTATGDSGSTTWFTSSSNPSGGNRFTDNGNTYVINATASKIADSDIKYVVYHYQENIGNDDTLSTSNCTLAETETLAGSTGASVTPSVNNYVGFTSPSTQTVTISADGSTTVYYFYTRNSYALTLTAGTGISAVTGAGTYDYNESVDIDATVSTGYTWNTWTLTNGTTPSTFTAGTQTQTIAMGAGAVTLSASATINQYTAIINFSTWPWASVHETDVNLEVSGGTLSATSLSRGKTATWTADYSTEELTLTISTANTNYNYYLEAGFTGASKNATNIVQRSWTPTANGESNLFIYVIELFTLDAESGTGIVADSAKASYYWYSWTDFSSSPFTNAKHGSGVKFEVNEADIMTGYEFDGWYKDINGDGEFTSNEKVSSDMAFTYCEKGATTGLVENLVLTAVAKIDYIATEITLSSTEITLGIGEMKSIKYSVNSAGTMQIDALGPAKIFNNGSTVSTISKSISSETEYEVIIIGSYAGTGNVTFRFTSDSFMYLPGEEALIATVTPKQIDLPIISETTYYYTGEAQTYYPANWSSIEQYVNITNNIKTELGSQTVTFSLKDNENTQWVDGTIEDKIHIFSIVEKTIIVNFDANGGTVSPTSKDVVYGKPYGDLPIPSKEGYIFNGWTGKNLISPYDIYRTASRYEELVYDSRNCIKFLDDGTVEYTGFSFKEKTQYTVSFDVKSVNANTGNTNPDMAFRFFYTDGTTSQIVVPQGQDWTHYTLTSSSGKTIEAVGISSYNYMCYLYIDVDTFQFEEGATATEYVPYVNMNTLSTTITAQGNTVQNGNTISSDTKNTDTYFRIYGSFKAGTTYTVCLDATVSDGSAWQFALVHSSTIYFTLGNGVNAITFTPTTDLENILFDDSTREADWSFTINSYSVVINGFTNTSVVQTNYDHTLTASWTVIKSTVSFDLNGGTGTANSMEVTFGVAYGTLPTPTRANYTFDGWYTAPTGGTKVTENTSVTAIVNHTLYAHWSLGTHKITIVVSDNYNYGTVSKVEFNAEYGSTIHTIDNVLSIGSNHVVANPFEDTAQYVYTFKDWTMETDTVTGDMTITASFERATRKYTVNIVVNDQTTTLEVEYGTAVIINGDTITIGETTIQATSTGKTFVKWVGAVGVIQGSITIEAYFE
ncbi:MAG: InlB B-repeat-containing protein, partial [Clostridia bacterium]|nr:InlB B-repeat-containing protein [Clostridia bacterium]